MRNEIPVDSDTIRALRGIVTAAANMQSDLYSVAVEHWTRNLSRDELLEVIQLLGVLLSMRELAAR